LLAFIFLSEWMRRQVDMLSPDHKYNSNWVDTRWQ